MPSLSDVVVAPPSSEIPAGAIPVSELDPSKLQADAPPPGAIPVSELDPSKISDADGVPAGAVPVAQLDGTKLKSIDEHLAELPRSQIVSEALSAQERGETNLSSYLKAYTDKGYTGSILDKGAPGAPTHSLWDTYQDLAEGTLASVNEIAKGVLGMDPMAMRLKTDAEKAATPNTVGVTMPDLSEQDRQQAVANVNATVKVKALQGLDSIRTFANRVVNKFFFERDLTDSPLGAVGAPLATAAFPALRAFNGPIKRSSAMDSTLATQFEHDLAVQTAVKGLEQGASYGQQRATDPETMVTLAKSPLLDPQMYIPAGEALKVGEAAGAYRSLAGAAAPTLAEATAAKAAEILGPSAKRVVNATKDVGRVVNDNAILRTAVGAGIGLASGGDVTSTALGALAGNRINFRIGGKVADAAVTAAERLAQRMPPGPIGRFTLSTANFLGKEGESVIAGQLYNMPFILGAGDEDSAKHMVEAGVVMHAALRPASVALSGLDIGRNLWAERQTLPDTRIAAKDYGFDPELDKAHRRVVDGLGNSSANFVQLVRDYFGKNRGEVYTLFPTDYSKAIDRLVADGHLSTGEGAQAKETQGFQLPLRAEDGTVRNVALSVVTPQTPGISVGHESGHLLASLLTPEERTHINEQIKSTFGPKQIAAYKERYEALTEDSSGRRSSLSDRAVLEEIFAEHVSAVLNSIPIENFSAGRNTKDFSRSVYSLVARGLEKIGARVPELNDFSQEQPTTGLNIKPSAKIGNLIENVLTAHALDSKKLAYDTPSGKPPITKEQATLSKPTPKTEPAPQGPTSSDSPVGAGVLNDDGTITRPGEAAPVTPEGVVAPRHAEGTHTLEDNVRVSRYQQDKYGNALPGQVAAVTEHLDKAFSGPRSEIKPVEIVYNAAKADETGPNQVRREAQRRAADALEQASRDAGLPNPLRKAYQKGMVPYGWAAPDKSAFHALSYDKVIQNVDLLQGWLHLNPTADDNGALRQYLASPELASDLQIYLRNQSHGYAGDGRSLARPEETLPGTVTPEDPSYKPTPLDPTRGQVLNLLMGQEQPKTQSKGQQFNTKFAELNGVEVGKVNQPKGPVTDVNPLRAALRNQMGFDPSVLNSATERINTNRVLELTQRDDLHYTAGDSAIQRAGFMPSTATRRVQGNDETRRIASDYMRDEGITSEPHTENRPVNEEFAKRVADFYDEAKSEPNSPEVQRAYSALADETMRQYEAMQRAGIAIEPFNGKGEPYKNSAEMMQDVRDNKHLYFLKTENAFGKEGDSAPTDNALLQPSGVTIKGQPLLVNDIFRAVHDFFGHTAEGFEFGPRGEYNAYLAHAKMFSDEAKPALAAETLAQNSWVNFGKHLRREDGSIPQKDDPDYVPLAQRPFGEQKNLVVPSELLDSAEAPAFMPQLAGKKLPHSVEEKTLSLIHYGDQGLKEINAKQFGKSGITPRSELSGANRHYWYEEGQENRHDPVLGRGSRYTAEVSGARIYDGDADPLDWSQQVNRWKADDMLKAAGYAGVRRTTGRGRNAYSQVELFEPVKPDSVEQVRRAASFMPKTDAKQEAFYSPLERTLRSLPEKANRQQIEAALRGAKAEEMRDVKDPAGQSFEDYLKANPQAGRQEMLDFVNQNKVEVSEKTLGDTEPKIQQRIKELVESRYSPEAAEHVAREEAARGKTETKYDQYVLPGGSNYREALFTLPSENRMPKGFSAEKIPEGWKVTDSTGHVYGIWDTREAAIRAQRRQPGAAYHSPHFEDVPGYLAHARYNERSAGDVAERAKEIKSRIAKLGNYRSENSLASGSAEAAVKRGHITEAEARLLSQHEGWRNAYHDSIEPVNPREVLHIEEIQSDLHQEGRKKGYGDKPIFAIYTEGHQLNGRTVNRLEGTRPSREEAEAWAKELQQTLKHETSVVETDDSVKGPPDAPFKKTWHELVFKQMLRKAAELGKDYLSWTTGEQQAERYDLSKQISRVMLQKSPRNTTDVYLTAHDLNGRRVLDKVIPPDEVENYVGKEVAKKLEGMEWTKYNHENSDGSLIPQDHKVLSGLDLKVGGEGMKGFYDTILPRFADKYLKKYGIKTETLPVGDREAGWASGEQAMTAAGIPSHAQNAYWRGLSQEARNQMIETYREKGGHVTVHAVKLTPELKKDILEKGQPLYMPRTKAASLLDRFNGENVKKALRETGWTILTATKEAAGAPDAPANIEANAKLEAELKERGLPYKVVGGSYNGVDQGKNFLIAGIPERSALALGKKYGQDSVLTNRGYLYQDGSVSPLVHKNTVVGEEATKQPGFSILPDGTAFSAGIDWDKRVERDPRDHPTFKELAKHLTPEEQETLRSNTAKDMVELFDKLPDDVDFETAARLGMLKRGWYSRAAKVLREVFGPDTEQFVSLLAATSPRQSVQDNMAMAFNIWQNWTDAGRPSDEATVRQLVRPLIELDNRENNSVRALQGKDLEDSPVKSADRIDANAQLSGFKVESFRRNLLADLHASTNDSWMAQFAGIPQSVFGTKAGYLAFTAKVRRVADKLQLQPAEVQETVWSFFKTLVESTKEGRTAKETLANLTEGDILSTPEFHDEIVHNPKIREALEKLGVSQHRIDSLADSSIADRRANASARPLALVSLPEGKNHRGVLDRLAVRAQQIKDAELAKEKATRAARRTPAGSVMAEAPGEAEF